MSRGQAWPWASTAKASSLTRWAPQSAWRQARATASTTLLGAQRRCNTVNLTNATYMRKLIILANVLVREDREWAPSAPAMIGG